MSLPFGSNDGKESCTPMNLPTKGELSSGNTGLGLFVLL
jgi:hypothetical protein